MRSVIAYAVLCLLGLSVHAETATAEVASPAHVGTNTDGNLEINAPTGKDVIINGVSFSSVLARLVALESRPTPPPPAPPATSVLPGVSVIGNTTFVTGTNVYFASPKRVRVIEQNTSSWHPSHVEINITDTVNWEWASNTSVYEVDEQDNTTARPDGIRSGPSTPGGSFEHQFLREGTFRFRALNTGSVMSIVVKGYGLTPERNSALDGIAEVKDSLSAQSTSLQAIHSSLAEVGTRISNLNRTKHEAQSMAIWTHSDPSECGIYTPPSYPASVFVELGGGGGGGARGEMSEGTPGGESRVDLSEDNPFYSTILTAQGGGKGRRATADAPAPAHGEGSSSLPGAFVRAGGGGAGGLGSVVS